MKIDPGDLNKRIKILLEIPGEEDEEGFASQNQTKQIRNCWASFSRTSGTEQIKSGKEVSDVKCRFLIRHSKIEITREMYIWYGSAKYNILYINDYEDSHEYDEIWCEKVV